MRGLAIDLGFKLFPLMIDFIGSIEKVERAVVSGRTWRRRLLNKLVPPNWY